MIIDLYGGLITIWGCGCFNSSYFNGTNCSYLIQLSTDSPQSIDQGVPCHTFLKWLEFRWQVKSEWFLFPSSLSELSDSSLSEPGLAAVLKNDSHLFWFLTLFSSIAILDFHSSCPLFMPPPQLYFPPDLVELFPLVTWSDLSVLENEWPDGTPTYTLSWRLDGHMLWPHRLWGTWHFQHSRSTQIHLPISQNHGLVSNLILPPLYLSDYWSLWWTHYYLRMWLLQLFLL